MPASDESAHGDCVRAWMRAAQGMSPEQLAKAFEHAFAALWERAQRTLGDVTLRAIVDRVVHSASERFPVLASLRVEESTGLQCEGLREQARRIASPLEPAIEYVLVEFLRILGSLTAEVLTPALHAVLSRVTAELASDAGTAARDVRGSPKRTDPKGPES
jgi:hypothetical protein